MATRVERVARAEQPPRSQLLDPSAAYEADGATWCFPRAGDRRYSRGLAFDAARPVESEDVRMSLIVSKSGKNARRIDRASFESEDELQRYIHENPDSIPLNELKEDVRLFIAAREFPTESGPIDAVGMDRDGDLYLVETKLYRNTDKRQVIAQVLDYGASLWRHYAGFERFIAVLDEQAHTTFGMGFREKVGEFFALDADGVSSLVEAVRVNLDDGSYRFVVLMDQLHAQLKDLILFLNQYSTFDVFAVEVEYYKFEDYEIIIPKLFGSEVKKDVAVAHAPGAARRRWDEASFFEDAKGKLSEAQLASVRKVYDFTKASADKIEWGTGKLNGSFNAKFVNVSNKSLYSIYSDGRLVPSPDPCFDVGICRGAIPAAVFRPVVLATAAHRDSDVGQASRRLGAAPRNPSRASWTRWLSFGSAPRRCPRGVHDEP